MNASGTLTARITPRAVSNDTTNGSRSPAATRVACGSVVVTAWRFPAASTHTTLSMLTNVPPS
jgi:hypothetical protein